MALTVGACASPTRPDTWIAPDATAAAVADRQRAVVMALAQAEAAHEGAATECVEVTATLWSCPTEIALEQWAWERHLREPIEGDLSPPIEPADPLRVRDGLDLHREMLEGPARRTLARLDLLEHTPVHNDDELDYFEDEPEVWADVIAVWDAESGSARASVLREVVSRRRGDHEALRRVLLRDGFFYFDDSSTARWAVRNLQLRDLFDDDEIVLERYGLQHALERGSGGHYYYSDPAMEGARAPLTLFDRVGLDGELEPAPTYNLQALRRQLGLEYVEVGAEDGGGRAGTARFLDGSRYRARLVRVERSDARLGLLGQADSVEASLEASLADAEVIYALTDLMEQMVRENLFFDEPADEVGQQDGIMRNAYDRAANRGEFEYTVNGVTYPLYDDLGRPRPPQVCIDFITDTVERHSGRWWPTEELGPGPREAGRINIRDYMPNRRVSQLLQLGEWHPGVARVLEYPESERVPYRDSDGFFDVLFQRRDSFRIGDVVTIYGLRDDGRNHYHAFYVFDTDPVFGMPIALADQAGHVRVRSWDSLMRTAPRRSVRGVARWNPAWIREPDAVASAASVIRRARILIETSVDSE